eukprot:CFRG8615T1
MTTTSTKRSSLHKPKNKFNEIPVRRTLQRDIWIAKSKESRFGIGVCRLNGDMYITHVSEGSIAWNAGLNIGDKIIAVGDVELHSDVEAQSVLDMLYETGPNLLLRVVDQPLLTEIEVCKTSPNSALGLVCLNGTVSVSYPGCAADKPCIADAKSSIISVDGDDVISMSDRAMLEHVMRRFDINKKVELQFFPVDLVHGILLTREMQAKHNV